MLKHDHLCRRFSICMTLRCALVPVTLFARCRLNCISKAIIARLTMPERAWAYYSSASDDEITNRENHAAFHRSVSNWQTWARGMMLIPLVAQNPRCSRVLLFVCARHELGICMAPLFIAESKPCVCVLSSSLLRDPTGRKLFDKCIRKFLSVLASLKW